MARQRNNTRPVKLKDILTTNQFILDLFGAGSFSVFSKDLKDSRLEGYDENNISLFYHELISRMFVNQSMTKDLLLEYDQNIYDHTQKISEHQHDAFSWKYFQYLSLLFTEIYLDRYFSDPEGLLLSLNDFSQKKDKDAGTLFSLDYQLNDLNKLAFWNATGSGKTLIMHVNILQYLHYAEKHKQSKDINRIILLTPNEGLSKQHLLELQKSGFEAELFSKTSSSLFRGKRIEIIDIHKLEEKEGDKTVAVDSFEDNNLVLVDEGHRGASGDDWKAKRDQLSANGFSFEYSATFGQAVAAATGEKRANLLHEYAKCTLFDYSYKYFYEDGYGKDYSILNLNDIWNQHTIDLYLTACLLNFYQQLKIFGDNPTSLEKFNLEKPLLIFVGSKVTAVRTEHGHQVSDVIQILQFLQAFIKNRSAGIGAIKKLLTGKSGLVDTQNRPLFFNSFAYLVSLHISEEEIYSDVISRVFNSTIAGAELHLDNLRGADGEIGLRVGDASYFGVINVGDDAKLLKLCEEQHFLTDEKEFSESLFHSINKNDSPINVLIGSKKFTEGWNSWRVSTMGLMNVGKGEGTEIIQLFGRGVRLKGYNYSLKRSDRLDIRLGPDEIPKHIKQIETLYIFGIKANYMQQFKEYLEEEGLPTNDSEFEEISIPTLPAVELINQKKLKILKVKDGIDFKPILFDLFLPSDEMGINIGIDWYPKIQILKKTQNNSTGAVREEGKLDEKHLAFLNWDKIFFEIQKQKNINNWHNMGISKSILQQLMRIPTWYTLYIPSYELEVADVRQVNTWQEIVSRLLTSYCAKLYNYKKSEYLSKYLEYAELDPTHPNFVNEYKFLVEKSQQQLIASLKQLQTQLTNKAFSYQFQFNVQFIDAINFDRHLYKPLFYIGPGAQSEMLKLIPMQLVESEKQFVEDLKKYYINNQSFFEDKELFLLRNLSKKGVGYFEANNFYPDFIMWIISKDKQYISFIDPKGLRQINGFENPKLRFYKTLKDEIAPRMNSQDVVLNSFIVTQTALTQLNFWQGGQSQQDFEDHHVYFMSDNNYIQKILNKIIE